METTVNSEPGYSILADLEKPLNLPGIFGNNSPVELEVGAGRGDFAVHYCKDNPSLNLLCVERKLNYLKRGVNKARAADLQNIQFFNVEIKYLLLEYIVDVSLTAVHIYFPDPWPKKKQKKRRIFQDDIIPVLARKLQPGGYLHLRTDHADYFEAMMSVMAKQTVFEEVPVPEYIARHLTGFEKRFLAQNLPIYRKSYRVKKQDDSI